MRCELKSREIDRWSGIGMGASRRMLGTDMYIAWQGTYGSWVHSRRRAMKNEMPQVMEVQFITPRPIQVAPPPWANLAYSFSRPTRVGENVISADSRYIYAYGDSPGFQRDDWRSGFAMHSEKGLLPPLSYGGQAPTVNSTTTATQQFTAEYRNVVMIHGILMFVAWGVIPFAGIFIARFMKARWPEAWLKIHMGLMAGVTGLLTGLAFIFIATTKSENHFEEPHTILGLTVVVCTLTQLCFGSLSASLWDEDMKSPWYNALHRWFGRVSLILGITNIYLGIEKYCSLMGYNESFVAIAAGYWVWIFCSTLVLVVTQYIFAPAQLSKAIFTLHKRAMIEFFCYSPL